VSPRGSIGLDKVARAIAWLRGRDYVTPEDVQAVVHDVFRHHDPLVRRPRGGVSANAVIDRLVQRGGGLTPSGFVMKPDTAALGRSPAQHETLPSSATPGVNVDTASLAALEAAARDFHFLSRQPVHSLLSGRHGSRVRGRGLAFGRNCAPTCPGTTRTMDWRVTARTGKPHVRVYAEEKSVRRWWWWISASTCLLGSRRAINGGGGGGLRWPRGEWWRRGTEWAVSSSATRK
jgi:hypothetical protein